MSNTRPTSIVASRPLEREKEDYLEMPTMVIIGVLVCVFFMLKFFIYIKDDKRHGK